MKTYYVCGVIQFTIKAESAQEALEAGRKRESNLMARYPSINIEVDNVSSDDNACELSA